MPLVRAHTTLMLPEALVIECLLEAHGIRFANAVLAFVMLIMGAPFPFWYRGCGLRTNA